MQRILSCPLLALVLIGAGPIEAAASLRDQVAASRTAVFDPDHRPLPADIRLTREWEGDVCRSRLVNDGGEPVVVGDIVVAEFAPGLRPDTPVYGEGFTMLSQTGGTLAAPVDEGFFADRQHYRLPEPEGRRTVYGVMTLRPTPDRAALLGFTAARRFVGRLSFDAEVLSISLDGEGLTLAPGEAWELEPLLVREGPDREALLAELAAALAVSHPPIFRRPVATGWCSWYCFGPGVTAEQIEGNLEWARTGFPGLRYIQIDDGYQPWMGDWLETGKSFGGDIRKVLQEIKTRGFEPAIWVAPFVASPQSRLFQTHPGWFLQGPDGTPLRSDKVGFGGWRLGPWYVLDGTHPEAQRWLEDLFRTLREEWGCTYFKLDANYWGALRGGRHHDPNATRVEAYRRGMEAIRRGAGDAFILGCNHPLWPSLGLIHGSRSSMDVSRDWGHFAKTGRENLLRGWQNGRLWWNDPDALCLNGKVLTRGPEGRESIRPIGRATPEEFLFHATLVYATGGMLLAGDDMRTYGEVEKSRLDVLHPPTGEAMRFGGEDFSQGRLRLPDGERVALLNWDETEREFVVELDGAFRVTELWSGADLGVHSGQWTRRVAGHAGVLLRLESLDRKEAELP